MRKWYLVTIINECTEELHGGIDAQETFIVPDADLYEDYLASICFCDSYRFDKSEEMTESEADFFSDIIYTLSEASERLTEPTESASGADLIESGLIYYANQIYASARKGAK